MPLYSVRMRASRARSRQRPEHISGAGRIVAAAAVPGIAAELGRRALSHPKGQPDSIHISVEALDEDAPLRIPALPARAVPCADAKDGLRLAAGLLREAVVSEPGAVIRLLLESPPLRGAMLVDADTLERLEPDRKRGPARRP